MNLQTIYQINLPKDILHKIRDYLYHVRDESYYLSEHRKKKYRSLFLIRCSNLFTKLYEENYFSQQDECILMDYFGIYGIKQKKIEKLCYYNFEFDIDRSDERKRNLRYRNRNIRIHSWFCRDCGNYIENRIHSKYIRTIRCGGCSDE